MFLLLMFLPSPDKPFDFNGILLSWFFSYVLAASCQLSFQNFSSFQFFNMSGLPSFLSGYFLVSSWIINGICVEGHLCSSSTIFPKFQSHWANSIFKNFLSNSHLQTHNDPNCIHHYPSKTHLCAITEKLEVFLHFPLSLIILFASPSHNPVTS